MTIKHDGIPFKATEEQIQYVKDNAHLLTAETLADFFGIARRTIFKAFKRDPELYRAWIEAKTNGINKVASALYKNAIEGNVPCQMFYLKCQAGWQEKGRETELETSSARTIDDLYSGQGDVNDN